MEEFTPSIHSREVNELIVIASSSTDDWQQEAIDQAKAELRKRGISAKQQKEGYDEIKQAEEQAWQEELERRRVEDYSLFDKIWIALFWIKYIFRDWGLRSEGYELKAKRRLQLLGLGLGWTTILIIWSQHEFEIQEQKRIEEIEKVDISEWEKNRLPYDTIKTKQSVEMDTNSNKLVNVKSN